MKLDKAKSDFIYITSHQLRTPLTAIYGYITMLEQGDYGKMPAKYVHPFDIIHQSAVRIIRFIEDLLSLSRIESGKIEYTFEKVDIAKVVESVYEELIPIAKEKHLSFDYARPKNKLPKIMVDEDKIRHVFMNLMDNAVKYTKEGFVKVKLEQIDDKIRFSVTDSGRGILPEDMPLLFQKFSRGEGAHLSHTEGTGLGLYVARVFMDVHKGRVWAESPGEDKGSTFIVEFQIGVEPEAPKVKKNGDMGM